MGNVEQGAGEPAARLQRLGRFLALDPDNTALLHDYANEAWRAGEYEACVMALEKLIRQDQAELGVHVLLARALGRQGQLRQAAERLRAAAAKWPADAVSLAVEQAFCHFAAHEFDTALAVLPAESVLEAPAHAPLVARATGLRIRTLHHLGHLDAAAQAAQRFEARHGANAEVRASLLAVLVDQSQLQRAVQLAQDLLPPGDDIAAAPYEVAEPLALQALDEQNAARALHWVAWAQARRSDDGRIWLLKGLAHLQAQQGEAAIQALERAAERMPGHAGSHLGLGWACLLQGDRARARQAFNAAAQASPAFAEVHGSLAVVDAAEGHKEAARSHLRVAQGLDRRCASAQFAQALLDGRGEADIGRMAQAVIAHARAAQPNLRSH